MIDVLSPRSSPRSSRLGRRSRDRPGDFEVGTLSDAGLVIAMARGRSDALAEAYRRHGPAIYHLAHDRWGQRRAEEVTLAAFLALWRSPDAVDLDGGSLRSYLWAECRPMDTAQRNEAAGV